jgi:hypothetical protein
MKREPRTWNARTARPRTHQIELIVADVALVARRILVCGFNRTVKPPEGAAKKSRFSRGAEGEGNRGHR